MLVCNCSLAGTVACYSCSAYLREFGSNTFIPPYTNYEIWTSNSTEINNGRFK